MRASRCMAAVILLALFLYGCSRSLFQKRDNIYRPPALGAESRFDEGLRREKHPQQLFSKKERREMEKMGAISDRGSQRDAPAERISRAKADSVLYGIKPDTTAGKPKDSTAVPVVPDSTVAPRRDTVTGPH